MSGSSPHSGRAGAPVIAAAICLALAALAYAYVQSSVGSQTAAASTVGEAARERLEVEAEIERTDLPGEIQAALGGDFAGVWFDRRSTQLHAGVISPGDAEIVEAVAAQAGVDDHVTATPVDSTWAQLQAAQESWGRRLADLFARTEAVTSLRPQSNALAVELGAAVSGPERSALEQKAARDDVRVLVTAKQRRHFTIERDAQCGAWAEDKAFCDPTIVGGVTIQDEKPTGKCTAGPTVFLQDHTKPTETYILTAGHCIDKNEGGEGIGGKWFGWPKGSKGEAGERKEIGKAVDYINSTAGDVGVIKVENTYWTKAGFTPVVPGTAIWTAAESEPNVVTAEAVPTVGLEACMSGQSSGTSCGEVKVVELESGTLKGYVEVAAGRKKGDSGATWYKKLAPGTVLGTHVGVNTGTGRAVFGALESEFKELPTKLQLLTESNQERHAFKFEAEAVPATLTGKGDGSSAVIKTTAGVIECKEVTYTGSQTEKDKVEFELAPTFSGCTSSGLTATIDVNECKYRFTVTKIESFTKKEGSMDLVCPPGKEITATVKSGEVTKCTIHVPPLSNLRTVTYTNVGTGATREITIDVNFEKLAYVHTAGTGIGACTTGAAENGTLEAKILVTAENGAGAHVGFYSP
jgi:hypothetical protein